MAEKIRIDQLLVQQGLIESRSFAQKLIMSGKVRVDEQVVFKPSQKVLNNSKISIDPGPSFVSRGGEKLSFALDQLDVSVTQRICADVGSSTGGFTDCLLQRGADRVYAIDAGRGQLHWKLRNDPRVVVMERTNARYLESLDDDIDLATIDVSFISLRLILGATVRWLGQGGQIVALIKPQFEAGKVLVGRGGVVKDAEIHRQVIINVLNAAYELSLYPFGLIRSPLKGPKGNIEFFVGLAQVMQSLDLEAVINEIVGLE